MSSRSVGLVLRLRITWHSTKEGVRYRARVETVNGAALHESVFINTRREAKSIAEEQAAQVLRDALEEL